MSFNTRDQEAALAHLHLNTTVCIKIGEFDNFQPKAKKARAVLAMMALSDDYSVSRQQLAMTLWSSAERYVGLARVRDLLHKLRKELNSTCPDLLITAGDRILFRPGSIEICNDLLDTNESVGIDRWSGFLADLNGVDPALDSWLRRTRTESRRKPPRRDSATTVQVAKSWDSNKAGPTVVVTELEVGDVVTDVRFAKALTDELGGSLSKMRWFKTVTRGKQGERLSNGSEDLSTIGDYALVGVLQCVSGTSRLLAKLLDLRNDGAILWAFSFREERSFTLEVQELLANAVAACVDTELLLAEIKQRRDLPAPNRSGSYALVLEAIPAIYRLEREPFIDAGHLLEEAVAVDDESGIAHGWLAYWHIFFVGQGWATNPSKSMIRASRAADRARLLDPKDARAITISAHVKAFLSGRLEEATSLHELALRLNPALALGWHLFGMTHAYAGRLDDAFGCISKCRKLAQTDPLGFFAEGALGIVHLLRHDHEAAVELGRLVTERQPNFTSAFKSYLSALGHLGRKAEAKEVLGRLLLLDPRFSLRRFHATSPYKQAQHLEHYMAGLRLAGVT